MVSDADFNRITDPEPYPSVEDRFVTTDRDAGGEVVTFRVVEDESGDIWWSYGHVPAVEFIAELNRWLVHTMGVDEQVWSDPEQLRAAGGVVEHLWARFREDDDEHFDLREPTGTESDAFTFPVTRLML